MKKRNMAIVFVGLFIMGVGIGIFLYNSTHSFDKVEASEAVCAKIFNTDEEALSFTSDLEIITDEDTYYSAISEYFEDLVADDFIEDYASIAKDTMAFHDAIVKNSFSSTIKNIDVTESDGNVKYTAIIELEKDGVMEAQEVNGVIQFDDDNKIDYISIVGYDLSYFIS